MGCLWKNVRTEEREEESYLSKDIPKEGIGCTKGKQKIRTMKQLFPKKGGEEEITKIEGGIRIIDRNNC